MNIVTKVDDWLTIRKKLSHHSIGFVHTMGNLHAGHMSLCQHSKQMNDITVAAIFVNPAQFNEARDFDLYPRTLEQDVHYYLNIRLIIYYCLMPTCFILMIPHSGNGNRNEFSAGRSISSGHFTGMLTIVLKFLNIVQPARSYYGEKDYQQLLLIQKMVESIIPSH